MKKIEDAGIEYFDDDHSLSTLELCGKNYRNFFWNEDDENLKRLEGRLGPDSQISWAGSLGPSLSEKIKQIEEYKKTN